MADTQSNHSWTAVFQPLQEVELQQRHGNNWTLQIKSDLEDELTSNQRQEGWKVYISSSFGRFTCPDCRHSWNSARVSLTFHYRRVHSTEGKVHLRTYRQICRNCKKPEVLLTAAFEEDKRREVLMRLISKIRKNCYNEDMGNDHHHVLNM
ncbi:receptor-transporting protein 2 [Ascaphus truei]|uniref:receptor-transporting protein 2 n=1 Tax=Ascaphus truei TaxID=8439 RepID=UPI003F5A67C3